MTDEASVEMDDSERDAFLGTGGVGVLSLSTTSGDAPHSLPVSYGYDAADPAFYFRLAVAPDSEKGDLGDRPASVVVHGQFEGSWASVVAKGRLQATDEAAVGTDALQGFEHVHIPLVDIFGRPVRDVPFEFYRLVPEEFTARQETRTAL